jgi:hypothetical protein
MTLTRKLSALLAMATALLLLFVVICPVTPTPITVVSAKATLPAPMVAFAAGTTFSLSLAMERTSALSVAASNLFLLSHASVLDLTCVRLC